RRVEPEIPGLARDIRVADQIRAKRTTIGIERRGVSKRWSERQAGFDRPDAGNLPSAQNVFCRSTRIEPALPRADRQLPNMAGGEYELPVGILHGPIDVLVEHVHGIMNSKIIRLAPSKGGRKQK